MTPIFEVLSNMTEEKSAFQILTVGFFIVAGIVIFLAILIFLYEFFVPVYHSGSGFIINHPEKMLNIFKYIFSFQIL